MKPHVIDRLRKTLYGRAVDFGWLLGRVYVLAFLEAPPQDNRVQPLPPGSPACHVDEPTTELTDLRSCRGQGHPLLAAFRAFGEAHRDRHESCVGCRLRRGGQVERIGRSAAICLACPGVRTPMVGWAPRAKPTRRPACSSTGPRLRRYGQVSAQQGRAPLDRPLRAPINLKPMHHAFRGDGGRRRPLCETSPHIRLGQP